MKIEEILPEIRKGRKFRRKCWTSGYFHANQLYLDDVNLNAQDWELEPIPPQPITITLENLIKAWNKISPTVTVTKSTLFKDFVKELGFEFE